MIEVNEHKYDGIWERITHMVNLYGKEKKSTDIIPLLKKWCDLDRCINELGEMVESKLNSKTDQVFEPDWDERARLMSNG